MLLHGIFVVSVDWIVRGCESESPLEKRELRKRIEVSAAKFKDEN
jgi:hypothetical protein